MPTCLRRPCDRTRPHYTIDARRRLTPQAQTRCLNASSGEFAARFDSVRRNICSRFLQRTAMSAYEFTLSLRIRHPFIDPTEITDALGIEPQHAWQSGQPRCDVTGSKLGGCHRDSYWMTRLMVEPQLSSQNVSVEAVLWQTLTQIRRAQLLLDRVNSEGGAIEILVSIYSRDVFKLELATDALTLLGRLHISIALDIHPHSPVGAPAWTAH